jgi:hypothetical protein
MTTSNLKEAVRAAIDRLMLEWCPDEMTPHQMAEWAKAQVAAPGFDEAALDAALAASEARAEPVAWALPIPETAGGGHYLRATPTADRPGEWVPLYTHPLYGPVNAPWAAWQARAALAAAPQPDEAPQGSAPDAADFFRRALEGLVASAKECGLVLTVEQVNLQPPRAGHYETRVSVRPARGRY